MFNECNDSQSIMLDTVDDIGFEAQPTKVTMLDTSCEHLGIILDTVKQVTCISDDRLNDIKEELQKWTNKKVCTKCEILSLVRKLTIAAHVIKPGRTFTRRLIDLSKHVKYLHYKIHLYQEARADIECGSKSHNGVSMFPTDWSSNSALHMWTDASDKAIGAVYKNEWFIELFDGVHLWLKNGTITWRELY